MVSDEVVDTVVFVELAVDEADIEDEGMESIVVVLLPATAIPIAASISAAEPYNTNTDPAALSAKAWLEESGPSSRSTSASAELVDVTRARLARSTRVGIVNRILLRLKVVRGWGYSCR